MRKKKSDALLPYALLLPAALLMIMLVFYPVAVTFTYSLKEMKLTAPQNTHFIGAENYIEILKSQEFWYVFQNTAYLLVLVAGLTTVFGLLVSLILNADTKISGLLTAAAILPWAMPPIVNGIIWRFVFHSGYGFMNKLLLMLGLIDAPIEWLADRWLLLTVAGIVAAWRSIPFCAIVCLSGLRTIPEELYEAAKLDGCGRIESFFHITLPLSRPFVLIGLTSASITAVNLFDEIVALSGYSDLGKNLLIQNYLTTFSFMNYGRGSAYTYLIMLLAAVLGFFYLRSMNQEEQGRDRGEEKKRKKTARAGSDSPWGEEG